MLKALTWGLPAGVALVAIGLLGTERGRKVIRGATKETVKLINKVTEEAKDAFEHTQELVSDIMAEAKAELDESKHNGKVRQLESKSSG